ncbi:MAG: hypothetical protein KKH83_06490, partial [Candidatus Margulisbacteria bacterium]|nr:hypothetical protein [Candidatus Margulisiibacteriota bacterium]
TTIVKIVSSPEDKEIFGDKNYISRYQTNPTEKQIDLSGFIPYWNKKWKSFGSFWNTERQIYRFLFDSVQLFYYSFKQLKINKYKSIRLAFEESDERTDADKFCEVSFHSVYHHGKKCIDLLRRCRLLNEPQEIFCKKFTETRNKFIEHNFNPLGVKLLLDPVLFDLTATDSLMKISIHRFREGNSQERAFDAYVDYYKDYYELEKIISDIITTF